MKIVLLVFAMMLAAGSAVAQNVVPPEVVRLENVQIEGDMKTVYVGNANNHYMMYCNTKAPGCVTSVLQITALA